jgi:hypothetical protein
LVSDGGEERPCCRAKGRGCRCLRSGAEPHGVGTQVAAIVWDWPGSSAFGVQEARPGSRVEFSTNLASPPGFEVLCKVEIVVWIELFRSVADG